MVIAMFNATRFLFAALVIAAAASAEPNIPDLSGMDRSILPGTDFFAYANGDWLKNTAIPPDRSSYGSGTKLAELTDMQVADLIVEMSAKKSAAGSEARKIGDYYASVMDEALIESKGLEPLKASFADIAQISNRAQLAQVLGKGLRADVDVLNSTQMYTPNLFGLWVAQDLNEPSRYSPFLLQGGLGMPDRDYYFDTSAPMVAIREKYRAHLIAVLSLAGFDDAAARGSRVYELERRMAETHWPREKSEQIDAGNNHWNRAQFDTLAPGLNWQSYFAAAGLKSQGAFVVWQPSALTGLSKLTQSESLDTWKDYLRIHALEDAAGYLPKRFVDEHFAFYGTALSGTPQLKPRWERAVAATNGALGEAVGKIYVEHYFSPQEKARAETMVHNLLAAFSARIDALEWMAPATKEKAKAKLAVLKVGVGYPDHWRSYAALQVIRGDALGNLRRAGLFEYQRNLHKLGRPVDRSEWVMNPQTVNAVNLPAMNAINFPAAILQPPFFDAQRPLVMDYGSIGATIGHEISHSFDDQGALFDADGRLSNWWQPEDFAHFRASGANLAAQYDAYRPFPDLGLNGKQTLGENIADVAGLNAAFDAYRRATQATATTKLAGFTSDQLFFISFGQSWRQKAREPALRGEIITDGHAPAEYRADTVRNLDAWYAAFDVAPGQALYLAPKERVRVW
jgi:putative endopeptidase